MFENAKVRSVSGSPRIVSFAVFHDRLSENADDGIAAIMQKAGIARIANTQDIRGAGNMINVASYV